jgi:lipopolysaccharide/colanic/teichoic acid biosynthesis glycosyltransferase
VENGRTGLLHAPGDVPAIVDPLRRIIADADLRRSLGAAARNRVERDFGVARLTAALLSLYAQLLRGDARFVRHGWYARAGKRVFDVAVAASALVLLSPLFAFLAMLVRATLGSPVLFRQKRPGFHGSPFVLVKFRSMTDRYDEAGRRLPDKKRLTRVGRALRATSLDELPELWNVLVGDMSLVGPRPLLMEYLPRYSARHAARHVVRPGLTGLAQVSGRNDLPWEERFELDLRYAERVSLAMDLKILARTVWLVTARRGISQPGHATAQEFTGMERR